MTKNNSRRARNWTFIVYPDSAPINWRNIIDDLHIEWVESPLHDKDCNPDGDIKKAHYHILVLYSGNKSFDQVSELSGLINATIPQICHDIKGLTRYMAHLDNPEKYQYSVSDIVSHGGVDLSEILKPSSAQRKNLIKEMSVWIRENNIVEYEDIYYYAMDNREDWFDVLINNGSIPINFLLKSRRHRSMTAPDPVE